jgi:hypothetical protein
VYSYPVSTQSVGGVLDRGYLLFKESFSQCWVMALLQSVAAAGANVYQTLHGLPDAGDPLALFRHPAFWVIGFVGGLLSVALYTAVMHRILDVATDRSGSLADALGAGFRNLPRVFAASILFVIAMVIGFVLLVVPGLYLSVALILFMPAIVVDGNGITQSLQTSRQLVKGSYWRTSAVVSVVALVLVVATLVVGILVGIVVGPAATMLFGDPRAALLAVEVVSVVVNVFASPLMAAVTLELYFDLKLRKEGGAAA